MIEHDRDWQVIEPWMLEIRRAIHQYPELGLDTPRTAALVETKLDELGIRHERVIDNGIKGWLGPQEGPALLLRADMDALPIEERNDLPFKSAISGRMHACGHDTHTAMLLGAARYLKIHETDLKRPVVLMFQPGEEGPGGALPMIEAGILDHPTVTQAAMVHISSELPSGKIGLRGGPAMGACDDFRVVISGRGGHGSSPQVGVDAIYVASAVIQAVQALVSREQNPFDPLVISIGTIQGGYRENVIADRVEMTGTIRSMTPATRERAVARFQEVVEGVARSHRATVDVMMDPGYPPLVADEAWVRQIHDILSQELDPDRVVSVGPTLGVEDFAYVAARVPAAVLSVGIQGPLLTTGLHSAGLMVDESALKVGAAGLAALALHAR
ncbi:amidohydrolase [Sulfobacillus acidophilus TPY]|uniref:Amidohydrolase n=1 Tax=Sulfobacillus acidophilus (strain ATCC 700253 / DSM 10332 / NAL) TaxID=679936 RepID=G8U1I3_SULAD|nr:amidohydrolase [Sulfobacillus acidophilus TPY]AEW06588.1 amidohydrolase [Sulfobacillus acidophilus DSM 10332]